MRKIYCDNPRCKKECKEAYVNFFNGIRLCLKCCLQDQEEAGNIKIIKEEFENGKNDEKDV